MSLNKKLNDALRSREKRQILRTLPPPTLANPECADEEQLVDFTSNDYLSLTSNSYLRSLFLAKLQNSPDILGSGGSRLLVNGKAHQDLEARLTAFFAAPDALLFNSGYDANAGFFACVPQPGDVVVVDEYVHASVHDGLRTSRVESCHAFAHNSVAALQGVLRTIVASNTRVRTGEASVVVAVESLYSMDGTIAPLFDIVDVVEKLLPGGNGHVVVDEAHATGIYGLDGRGLVSLLGLEKRVFARLHTFGKALGCSGGAIYKVTEQRI